MVWDIVELIGLLVLPVFLVVDLFYQRQKIEVPKYWRARAALVSLGNVFLAGYIAAFWGGVFGEFSIFKGAGMPLAFQIGVGVIIYQLIHYGYHRLAHGWNVLWRGAHQMHHSAESIDAFGAYYLHPVDNFFFTTWGSLVLFPLLGLSIEAGVTVSVFLAVNAVLQHANIRTPHWLGYFVQRPEMHRLHHGRGLHRYNYADLTLIDMIFGTYKNPKAEPTLKAGFWDGASSKFFSMLFFRDVAVRRFSNPKQINPPTAKTHSDERKPVQAA